MATTRILLALASILLAASAQAAFEPVSLAYEITGQNFRAPSTPNGGLSIRRCNDCTSQSIRVTDRTIYTFDGQPMTLDRFRDALAAAPADGVVLAVMHHLQTDTVLRVSAIVRRNRQ